MRCADEFKIFTNINSTIVDPKDFDSGSFVDFDGDVCIIPPNSFALARTVEYFRIPRNVLTICLGKSTYARCGIIVNVTPLEPEWEGHVTLEFSNTTPLPAKIYANEGVAQMLFFESDEVCETSYKDRGGKYQGQQGVTLPKPSAQLTGTSRRSAGGTLPTLTQASTQHFRLRAGQHRRVVCTSSPLRYCSPAPARYAERAARARHFDTRVRAFARARVHHRRSSLPERRHRPLRRLPSCIVRRASCCAVIDRVNRAAAHAPRQRSQDHRDLDRARSCIPGSSAQVDRLALDLARSTPAASSRTCSRPSFCLPPCRPRTANVERPHAVARDLHDAALERSGADDQRARAGSGYGACLVQP